MGGWCVHGDEWGAVRPSVRRGGPVLPVERPSSVWARKWRLGGGESTPPFLFLSNIILTWQTHTHGAAHAVMQVNACVAWEVPDAASGGVMPHIFTGEGTRATHSHAACLALFRLTRLID